MSIVERALEKLREAHRGEAPSGQRVFGRLTTADSGRSAVPPRGAGPEGARAVASGPRIVIDLDALRTAGLLPPKHQERQIAEQYRQIKRPLVANAMGRDTPALSNGHVILMASAMPGEGKTFTSINLAFSLARERGISVVLVDADVAKPQVSKLFGVAENAGLLDALQDESLEIESLVLPTNVPGLALLPSGRRADNTTELLASDNMRALLRRLHENDARRIVVLDSPPLLLTTESHALAAHAGQVVLIVRAGHTTHQTVLDALSYLEGCRVALVLNQSVSVAPTGYYYSGYGSAGQAPSETPP